MTKRTRKMRYFIKLLAKFGGNLAEFLSFLVIAAVFCTGVFIAALNIFVKPYAMKALSDYLKNDIKCSFVYIAPFGRPRIICDRVRATNPFGRMVSAKSASVAFDFSNIRHGRISFGDILFKDCDVNISRKNGVFNLEGLIASVTAPSSGPPPKIGISAGRISFIDARAKFSDFDSGQQFLFPSSNIIIALGGRGTLITFISTFGSTPFTAVARHTGLWRIALKNRGVPVPGILNVLGFKPGVAGTFDTDVVYKGNFADKNSLNGNVFLHNLSYRRISCGGQMFFNDNKFYLELKGDSRKVSASGEVTGDVLRIDNAYIDYENLQATLAGTVSSRFFDIKSQFSGLKLKTDLFKGSIAGTVKANGDFKKPEDADADVEILSGSGEFSRLSALYNILQTLDVFNYLVGKFPDYTSSFPVTGISGKITKKGSVINIENVLIDNKHSRTSLIGSVDIAKNKLDLVVGFQVQKFVNDILSKIPVLGYILVGEKKSLLPVFVKVTGDMAKPKVSAMPAKTITGPLVGIIERTFKLPLKVFRKEKKEK